MIRCILLLLISSAAFAAPKSIEVWFLSAPKVSAIQELINRPSTKYGPLTAALQCQEMGDYCFDPQVGLYKKGDIFADVSPSKIVTEEKVGIPTAKSVERDMIGCDPNNYFDVFCGKARPEGKKEDFKLDIWVDTSSSMREMDFSDKEGGCFRKSLLSRLDKSCGFNQKMNVMMFDTSIKQAGTVDSLCNNYGLNDYKKLMDWIERSDAKKLIIITDIYELHKEFADFIEAKNGIIRGDKDPLTGIQMLNFVDDLAKSCK